jgi:hypothetical protein
MKPKKKCWPESGLPDFSWPQHTKMGKIYQMTINYTKWPLILLTGCKLFQMDIKYNNIFHSKALQNIPKVDFWFENKLARIMANRL